VVDGTHQLLRGKSFEVDQVVDAAAGPYPLDGNDAFNATVSFMDGDGFAWQRWADGTMRPPVDLRTSGGPVWRWVIANTPIGARRPPAEVTSAGCLEPPQLWPSGHPPRVDEPGKKVQLRIDQSVAREVMALLALVAIVFAVFALN
jgi:hypothetical protein